MSHPLVTSHLEPSRLVPRIKIIKVQRDKSFTSDYPPARSLMVLLFVLTCMCHFNSAFARRESHNNERGCSVSSSKAIKARKIFSFSVSLNCLVLAGWVLGVGERTLKCIINYRHRVSLSSYLSIFQTPLSHRPEDNEWYFKAQHSMTKHKKNW